MVGKLKKVNAILDDASNETFLNEQVAGVLGLHEPYKTVKVHVLNNEVETFQSMPVEVMIESVNGQYRKEIGVKTCPQNVTGSYKVEDWSKNKTNWPHLHSCDFATPAKEGLVDLLIGVDNADLLYSRADVRGEPGSPIARLGPLGWSCIGATEKQQGTDCRTHTIRTFLSRSTAEITSCCQIDEQVKRFWEVESYGTENMNSIVHTAEDREALKKVKESISHNSATSRYKIAIPWKENRPKLPDNKNNALSRLGSTERKLKKDEIVSREYQHTIKSYLEKGYLRKVGKDEVIPPEVWYLPHFPIIRMDKTTTKVRIVFDCSAKTDGLSLNDVINPGPKLQKELFDVLLRFRRHPVALACDVKEMYLQVEIEENDRPYFRVLWRDLDSTKEPDVYEFTRVVFGKNSAPMEAQFIAQENARLHQETHPLAAETVLKSTYMDDSIDSVETDEIGVKLYRQLSSLWNHAGMQARKWVSNSEAVMEAIPVEDQAVQLTITDDKYPVVKTLGVAWDSKEDILTLPASRVSSDLPLTKRNVLRTIAAVFDPLGFVSPFVMVAKVILQELWARGYDWDDTIEDEIAIRISAWFEQLHDVATIQVPRCLCENKVVARREMVTFVDASLKSYGAVVYLRCTYEDGTRSSRLIASKSKVAPLLPMTVPRLELMAAVLGLRLTQNVLRAFEMNMQDVSFYSDSADVLWWIRGYGRDFRPFIANRIGEIQMYSNPAQWQHVPTAENPADLCTRGATPLQLSESTLWWNGPVWLVQDTSQWPQMDLTKSPVNLPETKAAHKKDSKGNAVVSDGSHSLATKAEEVIQPTDIWRLDPKRFSDWKHLVRIQVRVSRFLTNLRNNQTRQQCQTELAPEEIRDAEDVIIRKAQEESFAAEYAALSKGKPLPAKSQLAKLSPRMDQQGVIRCNSRLYYAESLPYDARCPIILPRGHWVTKLIVRYYHALANHVAGTNFVLAQISQRFWIVAAREEIREWENECCTCQKRRNKLATQVMGPLPEVRLRFTYRAFDQTALDYAGPFTTVQGRGKQRLKRWLCLFTCLTTRAVHLEVAWGLDTDSFLNAFTRFTSRRGVPKEVISDNGTNFVGAVNELKGLVKLLDREKIQRDTTQKGTIWAFNPPGGPHFGGVFEIMVKAAKKAIYAVIKNSDVTDEELITICAGVEGFLNSRPITYQSMNPSDDVPLTPNHFLHGQLGGEFAPEVIDMDANPRERWRKVQAIMSRVWDRWLKEYLPTLNTRPKWTNVVKDLKDGDVVLVLDKDLPRGKWPLGRNIATYPGKDGHSRVAKVQLGNKSLVRPIHKLVPLRV